MLLMVGILTGCIFCREAHAQNAYPSASPTMTIVAADGTEEDVTGFDGSAPLRARFCSNVQDLGQYTPLYEWRIVRQADPVGGEETIVRYDADTEYTFTKSGSYTVEVLISFVQGTDTLEFAMDSPFTIAISESKLEVPNAFTPNGDGINDVFNAALRAMGKPNFPTVMTLIFMCGLRFVWVYGIFLLVPNLTFLYLVWPIGWVCCITGSLLVYFPLKRKLTRMHAPVPAEE